MMDHARLLAGKVQNAIRTGPSGVTHRAGRIQIDMGDGLLGDISTIVTVGPHDNWTAFVDLVPYQKTPAGSLEPQGEPPDVYYYIDSGYLAIGVYNANPSGGYIVERPVLHQNSYTLSLSDLLEATPPSAFSKLKPKEAVDGETPPSFDYPEDTGTLWDKVTGVYYTATPSNWSGKLRLMGQARYGRVLSSDWNLGVPSNTGGSTDGYGLYTDTNHRYWLIHVEPSANKLQITLTATLLNSPLYDIVLPVLSDPESTYEEKLIADAYALAFSSRSSTVITTTIDSSSALDGSPLAYQWHWLWNGSKAQIVVHKNMTSYYNAKHFNLTIDIIDGEIMGDVALLRSGSWAPGAGRGYVFAPLTDWSGSRCWGYGLTGTNTASAPLYCYVKSSGVVSGRPQSFTLVSGTFNQSVSVAEQWLSSCHDIPSFENSFSSDTHGRISAYTATESIISTSDGFSVEASGGTTTSVYKLTRTSKADYSQESYRASYPFTCYMHNPTCGVAVPGGTYSGARTTINYVKTCHLTVVNYLSTVTGYPVLIIPAGCPDACVLGYRSTETRVGIGYDEAHKDIRYHDRYEHIFDSGGLVVCTEKSVLPQYDHYTTPPTTRYYTEAQATYLTSFGSVPAQDLSNSWTSPISLSNPYTPNIAFIVQGVTQAARCAGADSRVFRAGNFPATVGDGRAACIGFA